VIKIESTNSLVPVSSYLISIGNSSKNETGQ